MLVHIVPTKDPRARHKAVPIPVRRRLRDDQAGNDPLCTYDAVRTTWEERAHGVPVSERTHGQPSRAPFFTVEGRARPWTSADSRALAKRYAALVGLDVEDFGGMFWATRARHRSSSGEGGSRTSRQCTSAR
eukprot:5995143-Pleurochrysis_carterae.AAC.2